MTALAGSRAPRAWTTSWLGWALLSLLAAGTALYSVPPYALYDAAANRIPLNPDYALHMLSIAVHAVPGCLALLLGPLQFMAPVRRRYPRIHRVTGRIYLASVAIGSIAAVPAAIMSTSGLAAQLGFLLLAAAWFYSGYRGLQAALQRDFQLHRLWMIRNYALSYAAVLLRVFLFIGILFLNGAEARNGIAFEDVYTSSVWCSILVSYVTAEWFIIGAPTGQLSPRPQPRPGSIGPGTNAAAPMHTGANP